MEQAFIHRVAKSDVWYLFYTLKPTWPHVVADQETWEKIERRGWCLQDMSELPTLKSAYEALGYVFDEEADRPGEGKLFRRSPAQSEVEESARAWKKVIHVFLHQGSDYRGSTVLRLFTVGSSAAA